MGKRHPHAGDTVRSVAHKMESDSAQETIWPKAGARARLLRSVEMSFEAGCCCRLCSFYGQKISGRMSPEMFDGYLAIYSTMVDPHGVHDRELRDFERRYVASDWR